MLLRKYIVKCNIDLGHSNVCGVGGHGRKTEFMNPLLNSFN